MKSNRLYKIIEINRDLFSNLEIRSIKFDILVHAANPAKRFFANSNPNIDFDDTVSKICEVIEKFRYKKLLLVSSLSCRTQPDSIYGKHRLICEDIARKNRGAVVRLGPLFGGSRVNDTLHDIVYNRTVFYSKDTRYCYANVNWVADYIASNLNLLHENILSEVGARDFVSLYEISKLLKSKSIFVGPNDDQIIESFVHGPSAKDVFEFARDISAK
jgi:hypothetical protein